MGKYKSNGCVSERDGLLLEIYIAKCIASKAYTSIEIAAMTELYYNMTGKRYDYTIATDKERGLRK